MRDERDASLWAALSRRCRRRRLVVHRTSLPPPLPFRTLRLSSRWLLEGCKAKLVPAVERITRDKDEHLQVGRPGAWGEPGGGGP